MARRRRKAVQPPPKPKKPPKIPEDAMGVPNHMTSHMIDLKHKDPNTSEVKNVFKRRHPPYPGAKKYYPDNPQGAMFDVTCLDPFRLEKLLRANPALQLLAQTAYRDGQRRRPSRDAIEAARATIDSMLAAVRQNLEPHLPLICEFIIKELVKDLQAAAFDQRLQQHRKQASGNATTAG